MFGEFTASYSLNGWTRLPAPLMRVSWVLE